MAHDTPPPLVGGIPDDSTTPIALGTTGFTPRPRAQSAPRSRTRSFTAKLAALSRGPVQAPLAASASSEEGNALLGSVKAARAAFASRTRRAFNSVFGPALGVPNRGDYVRLRGRN